jgi:predicted nucleic acid-binding protein
MMRIFIDTNIVLDFALGREPFSIAARQLFAKIEEKQVTAYITASSVTDIYYILKKSRQHDQVILFLKELLQTVYLLDVSAEIVGTALYSDFKDFEDAVQYYTAEDNHIDAIITRNIKDYQSMEIPIMNAQDFLAKYL